MQLEDLPVHDWLSKVSKLDW